MKAKSSLSLLFFLFITVNLNAQVFSGLDAFKKIIEYEGQRFLMNEFYDLKAGELDKLVIDKTIVETDYREGFMFVLTSYKLNNNSGAVITSFNSITFDQSVKVFRNIHLTNEELTELNELFTKVGQVKMNVQDHFVSRFNERLIVDVFSAEVGNDFVLWVDDNRHTFTESKWNRAFMRYSNFSTN